MTLKPQRIPPVPEETARVARAAFPRGCTVLRLREGLGTIYHDELFAALYPQRGQPAAAPWRLALVSVLQFLEGLSDRQAAEAVRARLDWKYALSLDLTDSGFDFSVLSEFRSRLIDGNHASILLEALLEQLKGQGLIKARGRQRTDSTHILAAVRDVNRLEAVGETLRATLNVLAQDFPEWLMTLTEPDWFDLYERRVEDYRLPKDKAERQALGERIGRDGHKILAAAYSPVAPEAVKHLAILQILRQTWVHQFYIEADQVHWRCGSDLPPSAQRHDSPYDADARYANHRTITWTGYRGHVTETCDTDAPHLIVHVDTTPATVGDYHRTLPIQEALALGGLLPAEHLVDAGYVDAAVLVTSKAVHQIEIVGPARSDGSWQGRADQGFARKDFAIDWEAHTVTCPQGQVATHWQPLTDASGNPMIHVKFPHKACAGCAVRSQCTKNKTGPRLIAFQPRAEFEALQENRQQQQTDEWRARYAKRAGVEGTISQAVRAFGMRHCRYIGLAKTHLQLLLTAIALNIARLDAWWTQQPLAKTRCSAFAALRPMAA